MVNRIISSSSQLNKSMRRVCVLTDSSAQFPQPSFIGKNLVRVIQLDIEFEGRVYSEGKELKINRLPLSCTGSSHPILLAPGQSHFQELFSSLIQVYDEILVLLLSNQLSPIFDQVVQAITPLQSHANIHIINSQTTSVGLGILVQMAAALIEEGVSITETERQIRKQIPHVYTLLCTPGLSYLHFAGILDHAQAAVAELINMYPIFTLEEGRLTPLEKVRSQRAALDFFQEFLDEFDNLDQIALLQGTPQLIQESRLLKQYVSENHPKSLYSEHTINLTLASLSGPRCLGLVASEAIPH